MSPTRLPGLDFDRFLDEQERVVTLPGQGVIRMWQLDFAWELERRGFEWRFSPFGQLASDLTGWLTPAECKSVRSHLAPYRMLAKQCEVEQ